jgi:starvation-inducible DNA-binding protein
MKNQISLVGLDNEKSVKLSEKMNLLLANYQLFYINARGMHWNIKGENFFELHLKFEELYTNIQVKIDEVAERILTLGFTPLHSYSDYLKYADIKESTNISNGRDSIQIIIDSLSKLIYLQREILHLAEDANDEGTNALMSDYIREQEKLVWMYNAYMG